MAGCVSPRKYSWRLVSCGRACKTSPCRTCFKPLAAAKITPRARGQKLRRPANIRRAMPRLCRHDKKSGRQAFATACAPTRQHQTPAFGSHTGAKSMAAFTHQIAWLESPFHVTHSLPNQIGKMPDLVTSSGRFSQKCPQSQRMHDGKIAENMAAKPAFGIICCQP